MGRESGRALLKRVDTVRRGIEAWRAQRPKPPVMPEELWAVAVSLARDYGVYSISQSLRVDYGALKQRVEEAGGECTGDEEVGSDFLELSGSQLVGSRSAGAGGAIGSVVEMSRADGSRLVVRLCAQEPVDVAGLAAALWKRGA